MESHIDEDSMKDQPEKMINRDNAAMPTGRS